MWGTLRKAKNTAVEPGAGFLVAHREREKKLDSLVGTRPQAPVAPQGIYLYGNVGCGKHYLSNLQALCCGYVLFKNH